MTSVQVEFIQCLLDTPDGGTKGADGNAKSSAASSAVPNFSTESPASQQVGFWIDI